MGWFVSLALFVAYIFTRDAALLNASGLFAIAGAIGIGAALIHSKDKYIKIPVNSNNANQEKK